MKLQVLHKGILILLIPLVVQWVFFAELYRLTQESARYAESEVRLSQAIHVMNAFITEFANCMGVICDRALDNNRDRNVDPDEYSARMHGLIQEAQTLVGTEPTAQDTAREANALVQDQVWLLRSLNQGNSSPNTLLAYPAETLRRFRPMLKKMSHELSSINGRIAVAETRLKLARKQELAAREEIQHRVLAGAAANTLLALGLLAFFLTDITNRLKIVVGNARAIPKGEALAQKAGGEDELAYLDGVLHQVAGDLHRAAEQRKSIISMVAHDLRSPLLGARMALLAMRDPQDESKSKQVIALEQNLARQMGLIDDLLTIEKLEAGKLDLNCEQFDINESIEEAIESVSNVLSQKGLTAKNDLGVLGVYADRQRVMQVINNLLFNAVKYSPNDSRITFSSKTESGFAKISITDQGPGVAREQQANLFDKFYQTDRDNKAGGFGLGLAICKLIVAEHGGTIGVASEPGSGSTFWFTLPTKDGRSDLITGI